MITHWHTSVLILLLCCCSIYGATDNDGSDAVSVLPSSTYGSEFYDFKYWERLREREQQNRVEAEVCPNYLIGPEQSYVEYEQGVFRTLFGFVQDMEVGDITYISSLRSSMVPLKRDKGDVLQKDTVYYRVVGNGEGGDWWQMLPSGRLVRRTAPSDSHQNKNVDGAKFISSSLPNLEKAFTSTSKATTIDISEVLRNVGVHSISSLSLSTGNIKKKRTTKDEADDDVRLALEAAQTIRLKVGNIEILGLVSSTTEDRNRLRKARTEYFEKHVAQISHRNKDDFTLPRVNSKELKKLCIKERDLLVQERKLLTPRDNDAQTETSSLAVCHGKFEKTLSLVRAAVTSRTQQGITLGAGSHNSPLLRALTLRMNRETSNVVCASLLSTHASLRGIVKEIQTLLEAAKENVPTLHAAVLCHHFLNSSATSQYRIYGTSEASTVLRRSAGSVHAPSSVGPYLKILFADTKIDVIHSDGTSTNLTIRIKPANLYEFFFQQQYLNCATPVSPLLQQELHYLTGLLALTPGVLAGLGPTETSSSVSTDTGLSILMDMATDHLFASSATYITLTHGAALIDLQRRLGQGLGNKCARTLGLLSDASHTPYIALTPAAKSSSTMRPHRGVVSVAPQSCRSLLSALLPPDPVTLNQFLTASKSLDEGEVYHYMTLHYRIPQFIEYSTGIDLFAGHSRAPLGAVKHLNEIVTSRLPLRTTADIIAHSSTTKELVDGTDGSAPLWATLEYILGQTSLRDASRVTRIVMTRDFIVAAWRRWWREQVQTANKEAQRAIANSLLGRQIRCIIDSKGNFEYLWRECSPIGVKLSRYDDSLLLFPTSWLEAPQCQRTLHQHLEGTCDIVSSGDESVLAGVYTQAALVQAGLLLLIRDSHYNKDHDLKWFLMRDEQRAATKAGTETETVFLSSDRRETISAMRRGTLTEEYLIEAFTIGSALRKVVPELPPVAYDNVNVEKTLNGIYDINTDTFSISGTRPIVPKADESFSFIHSISAKPSRASDIDDAITGPPPGPQIALRVASLVSQMGFFLDRVPNSTDYEYMRTHLDFSSCIAGAVLSSYGFDDDQRTVFALQMTSNSVSKKVTSAAWVNKTVLDRMSATTGMMQLHDILSAGEVSDLGIHCRLRDVLRLELSPAVRRLRARHKQLQQRKDYLQSNLRLGEDERPSHPSTLLGPHHHIFSLKHGWMHPKELSQLGNAIHRILENNWKLTTFKGNGAPSIHQERPTIFVRRMVYYSVLCLSLQGYEMIFQYRQQYDKWYVEKLTATWTATHDDETTMDQPQRKGITRYVCRRCAIFFASLLLDTALLPDRYLASIALVGLHKTNDPGEESRGGLAEAMVHVPYWNRCMPRAADTSVSTGDMTLVRRCRRLVAYHLFRAAEWVKGQEEKYTNDDDDDNKDNEYEDNQDDVNDNDEKLIMELEQLMSQTYGDSSPLPLNELSTEHYRALSRYFRSHDVHIKEDTDAAGWVAEADPQTRAEEEVTGLLDEESSYSVSEEDEEVEKLRRQPRFTVPHPSDIQEGIEAMMLAARATYHISIMYVSDWVYTVGSDEKYTPNLYREHSHKDVTAILHPISDQTRGLLVYSTKSSSLPPLHAWAHLLRQRVSSGSLDSYYHYPLAEVLPLLLSSWRSKKGSEHTETNEEAADDYRSYLDTKNNDDSGDPSSQPYFQDDHLRHSIFSSARGGGIKQYYTDIQEMGMHELVVSLGEFAVRRRSPTFLVQAVSNVLAYEEESTVSDLDPFESSAVRRHEIDESRCLRPPTSVGIDRPRGMELLRPLLQLAALLNVHALTEGAEIVWSDDSLATVARMSVSSIHTHGPNSLQTPQPVTEALGEVLALAETARYLRDTVGDTINTILTKSTDEDSEQRELDDLPLGIHLAGMLLYYPLEIMRCVVQFSLALQRGGFVVLYYALENIMASLTHSYYPDQTREFAVFYAADTEELPTPSLLRVVTLVFHWKNILPPHLLRLVYTIPDGQHNHSLYHCNNRVLYGVKGEFNSNPVVVVYLILIDAMSEMVSTVETSPSDRMMFGGATPRHRNTLLVGSLSSRLWYGARRAIRRLAAALGMWLDVPPLCHPGLSDDITIHRTATHIPVFASEWVRVASTLSPVTPYFLNAGSSYTDTFSGFLQYAYYFMLGSRSAKLSYHIAHVGDMTIADHVERVQEQLQWISSQKLRKAKHSNFNFGPLVQDPPSRSHTASSILAHFSASLIQATTVVMMSTILVPIAVAQICGFLDGALSLEKYISSFPQIPFYMNPGSVVVHHTSTPALGRGAIAVDFSFFLEPLRGDATGAGKLPLGVNQLPHTGTRLRQRTVDAPLSPFHSKIDNDSSVFVQLSSQILYYRAVAPEAYTELLWGCYLPTLLEAANFHGFHHSGGDWYVPVSQYHALSLVYSTGAETVPLTTEVVTTPTSTELEGFDTLLKTEALFHVEMISLMMSEVSSSGNQVNELELALRIPLPQQLISLPLQFRFNSNSISSSHRWLSNSKLVFTMEKQQRLEHRQYELVLPTLSAHILQGSTYRDSRSWSVLLWTASMVAESHVPLFISDVCPESQQSLYNTISLQEANAAVRRFSDSLLVKEKSDDAINGTKFQYWWPFDAVPLPTEKKVSAFPFSLRVSRPLSSTECYTICRSQNSPPTPTKWYNAVLDIVFWPPPGTSNTGDEEDGGSTLKSLVFNILNWHGEAGEYYSYLRRHHWLRRGNDIVIHLDQPVLSQEQVWAVAAHNMCEPHCVFEETVVRDDKSLFASFPVIIDPTVDDFREALLDSARSYWLCTGLADVITLMASSTELSAQEWDASTMMFLFQRYLERLMYEGQHPPHWRFSTTHTGRLECLTSLAWLFALYGQELSQKLVWSLSSSPVASWGQTSGTNRLTVLELKVIHHTRSTPIPSLTGPTIATILYGIAREVAQRHLRYGGQTPPQRNLETDDIALWGTDVYVPDTLSRSTVPTTALENIWQHLPNDQPRPLSLDTAISLDIDAKSATILSSMKMKKDPLMFHYKLMKEIGIVAYPRFTRRTVPTKNEEAISAAASYSIVSADVPAYVPERDTDLVLPMAGMRRWVILSWLCSYSGLWPSSLGVTGTVAATEYLALLASIIHSLVL